MTFLDLLKGTPAWVWILFAYLIFIGIKSLKTRSILIPRLFIVPLVLIFTKYTFIVNGAPTLWTVYLVSLAVALTSGYLITRNKDLKTIKGKYLIIVPGNYSTLILLLSFFVLKYFFGYLQSAAPTSYHHFLLIDVAISGLFAGYFLGRSCGYVHHYRKS